MYVATTNPQQITLPAAAPRFVVQGVEYGPSSHCFRSF